MNTPNILFVIFDDLNDAVSGMGGHPQARTPAIDRLMRRGVRFANAQCNAPLCLPSRASMVTGLHPGTTGIFDCRNREGKLTRWLENPIASSQSTWIERLRDEAGYRVYGTGKIFHNGHEKWSVWENHDGEYGFGARPSWGPFPWDGRPETRKQGSGHPRWQGTTFHPFDHFGPLDGLPPNHGWTLYDAPFRYVSEVDRDPMPDERGAAFCEEILGRGHDQPFLLCFGVNRPHGPMYAPRTYFDMFPLESVHCAPILKGDADDCARALTTEPDLSSDVLAFTGSHTGFHKYIELGQVGTTLAEWTQAYLASTAFADAQLGRVLDALERSPHADNTLIVLTSDNGFHMGEKEYLFKNSVWEESARVPFVAAGVGVATQQECRTPISLIDLYPTFCDFAGINPVPREGIAPDGHSLRPLFANPAEGRWDGPPIAFGTLGSAECLPPGEPNYIENQHWSIRSERYRYVRCRNGEEELYDHCEDTFEWTNRAADPLLAEEKARLRAEAETWASRFAAKRAAAMAAAVRSPCESALKTMSSEVAVE